MKFHHFPSLDLHSFILSLDFFFQWKMFIYYFVFKCAYVRYMIAKSHSIASLWYKNISLDFRHNSYSTLSAIKRLSYMNINRKYDTIYQQDSKIYRNLIYSLVWIHLERKSSEADRIQKRRREQERERNKVG